VIQGDLSEKGLVFSFGEEKAFLLWHVGGIERFSLCWVHSPFVAACFLGAGRVSLPQAVCSSIAAWGVKQRGCWSISFDAACSFGAGRVSFPWLSCAACEGKGDPADGHSPLLACAHCSGVSLEFGLP
jgi:hypothetical protein